MKTNRWMPIIMIGVMLLAMMGLMAAFGLMFGGAYPLQMIFSAGSSEISGMWQFMLIPLIGLLAMGVMMFFAFRRMSSGKGIMPMLKGENSQAGKTVLRDDQLVLIFNVPGVNCAHCKMKIEGELGKLLGVASVNVDLDAKRVQMQLVTPPTREEIVRVLTDIGYPPEN
jgi:copper chaperone CopZ